MLFKIHFRIQTSTWRTLFRVLTSGPPVLPLLGACSKRVRINFIKTEGFKEYGKILRLLDGYESKHAKMI